MAGNDVLSEGEIDALMDSASAQSDAAASHGGYRSFDFTARDQSVLGQFVALPSIIERQSDFFLLALDDLLSLEFDITAHKPELISYGDLVMTLGDTVGITSLEITPITGLCHIICEPVLLSFLVNQYFGGARSAPPAASERSSLTPSEMRLSDRVADLMLDSMVRAWSENLPLQCGDRLHAMYPDRFVAEPANDKVVRLQFAVSFGDMSSVVQVILPFAGLERHKLQFAPARRGREEASEGNGWEPYFRRELLRVGVELSGVFATRDMPIAELLQLQVGSVIPLRMPADVMLCVEGEPFASGEYGAHDGKKAIKIRALVAAAASAKKGG